MKQILLFLTILTIAFGQDNYPTTEINRIIFSANCTFLRHLQAELTNKLLQTDINSQQFSAILLQIIERKLEELHCNQTHQNRQKRDVNGECRDESVGDGWCDTSCNIKEKGWDGGDCCPHTCTTKERPFPCGSGGYQCKGAKKIPVWFAARTRLCYKWYADGDGGQCGGGVSNHLCAGVGELTTPYRDDTDRRPGGCRMSWGLETTAINVPEWFKHVSICFRWHADGDGGQCGAGAPAESCAPLGSYTAVYRDDTDRRPGGCQMSWKLSIPGNADYWMEDIAVCFQWYPDGDGGQCGGGAERRLCAVANTWTSYYRDDTDKRGGGCRMQWGLVVL